jgi:hypothetical protein
VDHSLTAGIKIVYPSQEFKTKQDEVVKTQSELYAEAQEHYDFIKVIKSENLHGYKQWSKDMTALKIRVRKALIKHGNWENTQAQLCRFK